MSCKSCQAKVYATGNGAAGPPTIGRRRDVCRKCPFSEKKVVGGRIMVKTCHKCECPIGPMTMLGEKACPDGRWPAITGDENGD